MANVLTRIDLPGVPAGTPLAQGSDGRYSDILFRFGCHQQFIDDHPELFVTELDPSITTQRQMLSKIKTVVNSGRDPRRVVEILSDAIAAFETKTRINL